MCGVELLALLRCGIAVSIASMETTTENLEKNMGDQWAQQLEKVVAEQGGWSEKNLKKKFESQPWSLKLAQKVRVDVKRLWPQYQNLKAWCINVANPLYVKFLNADLTLPSGTTKEDVMKFMRGVFWLLEQHKKQASAAKRKAKADAKSTANVEHDEPPEPPAAAKEAPAPAAPAAPTRAPTNRPRRGGRGRAKQVVPVEASPYQVAPPRGGATTAAAQVDVEDSQPDAAPQGAHNEESSSEASKDDVVEVEVEDVKEEAKDAAEMLIELNLTDRHDVAERCSDMPDSFEGPTQLLAWSMCGPIGDNENHIALTATSQPLPTRKALREDVREANRSSSSKGAPASSTDSSSHSTPQGRSSGASTPLGPAASHVAHEQRERFLINQTYRNQTAHSIASAMHRMQRMSELNMLMQMGEPEAQEKARAEMLALLREPAPPPPPTGAPTPTGEPATPTQS